jgi:transcriptional regulator with XRE-family HTH domain
VRNYERNRALTKAIVDDGREHREIADLVGVSRTWFAGVCSGRVPPSKPLRARIAEVLGRPEAELFDEQTVTANTGRPPRLSDAQADEVRQLLPRRAQSPDHPTPHASA